MRGLVVLGSTGSVGRQTLDVVRAFPDRLRVVGLAAGRNLDLLARQVAEFRPAFVWCDAPAAVCADLFPGCLMAPMEEMVTAPEADLVMVATVGRAGIMPTMTALSCGKAVALANKEVVVIAGEHLMRQARETGAPLLPVDSEASAIWQCLRGEDRPIARLIVTASGGAFRDRTRGELALVTPEQALKHPTWQMGRKITIDSATLMNKAFEVIEARHLFDVPYGRIEVVLHPQSVVHSMVEFPDGCVKAQLAPPDMRLPIQYAMLYPDRPHNDQLHRMDLTRAVSLEFRPLDTERFPAFALGMEAARRGDTYPAVLSGADDAAVGCFLEGRIDFLDIPRLVYEALEAHKPVSQPTLEELLDAEAWGREWAITLGRKRSG